MIDSKTVATSIADGLNGIQRAMQSIPAPSSTPEFERWKREMTEASKHVLMAFGIDPDQLQKPAFPCGGGWYVEWQDGAGGGSWRAVLR
jgi:hypothetical protein